MCIPGEALDDGLELLGGGLMAQVVSQLSEAGGSHAPQRLLARPRVAHQRVLLQQLIQTGDVQPDQRGQINENTGYWV